MKRERFFAVLRFVVSLILLLLLALFVPGTFTSGLFLLSLFLPPVSLCTSLLLRGKLHGTLRAPTSAAKDEPCEATLTLTNDSFLPAARLECELRIENELTGEVGKERICTGVGARGTTRQTLTLKSAHCGRLKIYTQTARVFDCFGLFSLTVPLEFDAKVTVLPELFPCEVLLTDETAAVEDGAVAQRGDYGAEVFQLREYRAGDDIRRIHYKLSSKLDTPIFKESSRSIDRSLLVLWDKRTACDAQSTDAMAEVTASVCRALCDSGTAFDLGWTEDEPVLQRIDDSEQLLPALAQTVTRRGSGVCPLPDLSDYARVICITADVKEDTQRGRTIYLSCAENGEHSFTPQDYRERLERLEI